MECVEAALKTSVRKEMALKTTSSQLLFDDFLSINVPNGVAAASCDDFFVDDLFDFSNEDSFLEEAAEVVLEDKTTNEKQLQQHSTLQNNVGEECNKCITSFAPEDELGSLPLNELCLPAVELDSLEWLSHFVEDSFASIPAAGALPVKPELHREVATPQQVLPLFQTPVPAKARSKRTRSGCRVWSLGSPAFTESSSSSSSSSSPHSPTSPLLIVSTSISPGIEPVEKPVSKKQMRKPPVQPKPVYPRKCSHCGVHNTPQWRAGPLGAKTLCNACGVRFKSGRLLPEYRPACSPTFSSELHSNHHRKVLEMRKKKEMELVAETEGAVPLSFEN